MSIRHRILTGLLIFAVSGLCGLAHAYNSEEPSPSKRLGSLEKSLLLPGWGQLAENHILEGLLFLSAELFCVYNFFSNNHKGNRAYESYKSAATVDDAVHFRDLTEKYDTRRNQYLLAAGAVWIINLIDIYIIVRNKKNKERNLKLGLESATAKKLVFTISYRF